METEQSVKAGGVTGKSGVGDIENGAHGHLVVLTERTESAPLSREVGDHSRGGAAGAQYQTPCGGADSERQTTTEHCEPPTVLCAEVVAVVADEDAEETDRIEGVQGAYFQELGTVRYQARQVAPGGDDHQMPAVTWQERQNLSGRGRVVQQDGQTPSLGTGAEQSCAGGRVVGDLRWGDAERTEEGAQGVSGVDGDRRWSEPRKVGMELPVGEVVQGVPKKMDGQRCFSHAACSDDHDQTCFPLAPGLPKLFSEEVQFRISIGECRRREGQLGGARWRWRVHGVVKVHVTMDHSRLDNVSACLAGNVILILVRRILSDIRARIAACPCTLRGH
nr:hypothetical protein [Nocardiopsis gilva]